VAKVGVLRGPVTRHDECGGAKLRPPLPYGVRMRLAGLAGVGAASLVVSVASAIVIELWYQRIIAQAGGPPPYVPQTLALAFLVGAFVAVRLGGLRALALVVAYAVVLLSPLFGRGVIEPLIQCAIRGCAAPTVYLERPIGVAWAVPGIAVGALLARASRGRIPLVAGLAAAGVLALGPPLENDLELLLRYTACFSPQFIERCVQPYAVINVVAWIASGIVAGVLVLRWGGTRWDVIVPAALITVTHMSTPIHDFPRTLRDLGLIVAVGQAAPLLGVAAFVLVALPATLGGATPARLLARVAPRA
jgi:hypothetical protein